LIEKIDYFGKWWFPKNPKEEYLGRLFFSEEKRMRIQLTSFVLFIDYNESKNNFNKAFTILGIATDGTKITLKNCRLRSSGPNLSGACGNTVSFQGTEFEVFCTFFGAHFEEAETVRFNQVNVSYSYLDQWAQKRIFGFFPKKGVPKGVKAKLKNVDKISYKIDKDLSLEIIIDSSPTTKPPAEISVKQSARLQISSLNPKPLEEFLEAIRVINNFLTLAVSFPTYPMSITAKTDSAKNFVNGKDYYYTVRIIPWQPSWQIKLSKKEPADLHPLFMLFRLNDINRKKKVFENWFRRKEVLAPVFDLYFGTLYLDGYISNDFLNLVQALEAYHQRVEKKQDAIPKRLRKKIDNLIEMQTDKMFKEFLAQRLKNSQLSLKRRLNDILDNVPQTILGYIGDRKTFVLKIVNTRNYYTHYNTTMEKNLATPQETAELIEKIRILLQYSLLIEMGFSKKNAEKIILKKINLFE
jgi:hypothetical protein